MKKHLLLALILSLFAIPNVLAVCGDTFCDYDGGETHGNCPDDCFYDRLRVNATKDTFIVEGFCGATRDNNYGTQTSIVVAGHRNTGVCGTCYSPWRMGGQCTTNPSDTEALIGFDISSYFPPNYALSTLKSATMYLYAYTPHRGANHGIIAAYGFNDTFYDSWGENTITWNRTTYMYPFGNLQMCYDHISTSNPSCNVTYWWWTQPNMTIPFNITETANRHWNEKKVDVIFLAEGEEIAGPWSRSFASKENTEGDPPPMLEIYYHPVICGDDDCESEYGENVTNCPQDCPGTCGDDYCNPYFESKKNCPTDCPLLFESAFLCMVFIASAIMIIVKIMTWDFSDYKNFVKAIIGMIIIIALITVAAIMLRF